MNDGFTALIDAVRAGDLPRVEHLVTEQKVDWRQEREEALYQAALHRHAPVMQFFLEQQLLPYKIAHIRKQLCQSIDMASDGELDSSVRALLPGHLRGGKIEIEMAVSSMNPTELLDIAIGYPAEGLFRFLSEVNAPLVAASGPDMALKHEKPQWVEPLVLLGADISFAEGKLFNIAIARGDTQAVAFMIESGVDVNYMSGGKWAVHHPLHEALNSSNTGKRAELVDMLLKAGADIRANQAHGLATMMVLNHKDAFDIAERCDPGTTLPLIAGLENHIVMRTHFPGDIDERFPYLDTWKKRNMVQPLFDPNADPMGDFYRNIKMIDIGEDDGFMLKAAIASPNADVFVPSLLSAGASPNTQTDRPLKLAVIFNRVNIVPMLVDTGGDLFANKAEAFDLARRFGSPEIQAKLEAAIARQEVKSRKTFELMMGDAMTAEQLKADGMLPLAARGGLFAAVSGRFPACSFSAADFLKPDHNGATLLSVLCARGEHKDIFRPGIWGDDAKGAAEIYAALAPPDQALAKTAFHSYFDRYAALENQKKLRNDTPKNKFSL